MIGPLLAGRINLPRVNSTGIYYRCIAFCIAHFSSRMLSLTPDDAQHGSEKKLTVDIIWHIRDVARRSTAEVTEDSFRIADVEIDQRSRLSVCEVYYGSRDDAVKSAAEVTAKRESSGDFGTTGLNVTRDPSQATSISRQETWLRKALSDNVVLILRGRPPGSSIILLFHPM